MDEALGALEAGNLPLDALRVRGFPFSEEVAEFIREHELVFVVEQNRDAQLRALLINEAGIEPDRLVPVLHYDGTPITGRFITAQISALVRARSGRPQRQAAE